MSEWKISNYPKDWNIDTLSSLCELITDGSHFSPVPQEDGEIIVNVKDMTTWGIDYDSCTRISKEDFYILTKQNCSPRMNDILLSKDGTIGRVVIFKDNRKVVLLSSIAILRTKPCLDPNYLHKVLSSYIFEKQLYKFQSGSALKRLILKDIHAIEIPYPVVISEQRKIACILSSVDTIIENTEATIAKYEAIKVGMMHDLSTRGIDLNTGKLRPSYEESPEIYKKSKLGWIPNEWKVDTLENSTDYVDYRGKTPPKSDYGIFLVTARNIKNGYIDYDNSKEYIPEYAYETAMSRGKAEIGDVVITTEAPMGNVAQIDRIPIALAQRVIKYRGKRSKLINDFLSIFLMSDSFQRQMISESTGSTVLGIKGSRLHKLLIAIPKKNEQIAISKRIKAINQLVTFENINLHKYKQLKQALKLDLLTGKVRVKYEEEKVEAV